MSYLRRPCPNCGHESDSSLEVTAAIRAEQLSFEEASQYWRGFRTDSCFFSYARCQKCALLYCPQYFSSDQLQILYSSMPDNSDGVDPGVLQRTHDSYARRILARGTTDGAYLELGPDLGLTTRSILARSRFSRIAVVEPNRQMHTELRTVAGGIEVFTDVCEIPANAKFDLVVAVHVLDHLLDLADTLARLGELSADDAVLSLVVHNEGSVLRKAMGRRWPPFCLQHPQLFSAATLRDTLTGSGWHGVDIHRTANRFPVRHLARVVADITSLPHSIAGFAPDAVVPVPLGNMIATAVR